MNLRPCIHALLLGLVVAVVAGCASLVGGKTDSTAALVLFRADSNVRNPAANDAYPGVRRIALRALDGRTRPDSELQLTDRVALPPGRRTLLFMAESGTRNLTLSELTVEAEVGAEYYALPILPAESGGPLLVELRRGRYGEVLARSALWTPPADAPRR